MNSIKVGAQLFVNRHDTPEIVEGHIRRMAEARFSILRIFVVWDHLEPREGEWRWEVYDRVFSAAAEHGIAVVATLMPASPPGWMRCTAGLQDVGNLDDAALWARSLGYVAQVVERWHSAAALDSWILWNEPARVLTRGAATMPHFREFLRKKYGAIAALNRLYFRQYGDFAEVGAESAGEAYELGFGTRVEEVDWIEFTVDHLEAKLREIAGAVRAIDTAHELHVNPHRISQCLLDSGQSIWREAEVVDFMGFSAHPPWHSTRFPANRVQQSVGMFADLVRSATRHPAGKFWCTELQGGPTVFTAFRPSSPSGTDITRWMWESAASGAGAIIFWCFNSRDEGYEAGEWSLCHANGAPSPRLVAATRLARFFAENAEWFAEAKPKADIAILHSDASQLLGLVEGEGDEVENPRNRQMAADAACGAYLMASDLGWEAAFVDERRIREGKIPARILIAPGCAVLDAETRAAIDTWVRGGGVFVADGVFGWKDANGSLARAEWARHEEIFGVTVLDHIVEEYLPFIDDSLSGEGWFFRLNLDLAESALVRACWFDGEPAVVENPHGEGAAFRIGTVFFQRYLSEPGEANLKLLEKWLAPFLELPVRLLEARPARRIRRLRTPQGVLGVVFGPANGWAEVEFAQGGRWQVPGGGWQPIPKDGEALLALDHHGVACFRADLGDS